MSERMYQCTKCKEYKAIQPLTECDDCIEKQHEFEEKAAKWDAVQWAIDNKVYFTGMGVAPIFKSDMERLEQLYKERSNV